jgi:DNA repair protein RecO (recombination protein O)
MASTSSRRVLLQPAYLLHSRPYRDTSRILELFTRDHGRLTLFARGARSGRSALAPVLQPFNLLLVSWSGRGEAGQLIGAEFGAAPVAMPSEHLLSGFYLNELMMKLFAHHDPHEDVFALYQQSIRELQLRGEETRVLRLFEKRLLQSLGYGVGLEWDVAGHAIASHKLYRYLPEVGLSEVEHLAVRDDSRIELVFSGASLLSLARDELTDASARADARRLLRAALDRLLDGRTLGSRNVLAEMRRLKK